MGFWHMMNSSSVSKVALDFMMEMTRRGELLYSIYSMGTLTGLSVTSSYGQLVTPKIIIRAQQLQLLLTSVK